MERNNSQEWIKELKIAVLDKDLEKIGRLSKREVPQFTSLEDAKEAFSLLKEATNILKQEQQVIFMKMKKLKEAERQINKYQMNLQNYTSEWKC